MMKHDAIIILYPSVQSVVGEGNSSVAYDANGNVAESRSNIENYQRVRRILRTPGLSDINDKTNFIFTRRRIGIHLCVDPIMPGFGGCK